MVAMFRYSDVQMRDNADNDNISQLEYWSCLPPLQTDYELFQCDDGGDGEGYDDGDDHLMVGVGALLHKQIVNCLIAKAGCPCKGVLSQVGQALLVFMIMIIIIIISIMIIIPIVSLQIKATAICTIDYHLYPPPQSHRCLVSLSSPSSVVFITTVIVSIFKIAYFIIAVLVGVGDVHFS